MVQLNRRNFVKGVGVTGTAAFAGCQAPTAEQIEETEDQMNQTKPTVERIAADPTNIPDPITRDTEETVEVELVAKEVTAEIEDGVTFNFLTFNEQVPGPMVRVRQGDTVHVTLRNAEENDMPHNVDFHACYGPGGGAEATTVAPGETQELEFKAMYSGAFIYHCAVTTMDMHISAGMFGTILVEPKGGLPEVDHEFYVGQHDVYTDKNTGEEGHHSFNYEAMKNEEPTYVLMNGEKYALTPDNYGAMSVDKGDTARVFFVNGGPNHLSSFHAIGNVWETLYPKGSIESPPEKYVETTPVPPGSTTFADMEFPVPGGVKLVDHALSRVANKGCMAVIAASGEEELDLFNPDPTTKEEN